MQDCRECFPSTGHNFKRKKTKQYVALGDFGLLYKIPSTSSNPNPLFLHSLFGLHKLKNSDCDDSVHHAMVSAWSYSTGQLSR